MLLAEPMTMATDYVLAALGVWLGRRLWSLGPAHSAPRWWAMAFWAMALAAFLGGTSHGFAPHLSQAAQGLIWPATMVTLGAASVLLAFATLRTLGAGSSWAWFLALEFLVYSIWVSCFDSDFRYAVLEYSTAMLLVLVAHVVLAARGRPGAWWVVTGIVISFIAAGIQQAGLAPHPQFNHNDLFHLVQMVGLVALYRGVAAGASHTPATMAPKGT